MTTFTCRLCNLTFPRIPTFPLICRCGARYNKNTDQPLFPPEMTEEEKSKIEIIRTCGYRQQPHVRELEVTQEAKKGCGSCRGIRVYQCNYHNQEITIQPSSLFSISCVKCVETNSFGP